MLAVVLWLVPSAAAADGTRIQWLTADVVVAAGNDELKLLDPAGRIPALAVASKGLESLHCGGTRDHLTCWLGGLKQRAVVLRGGELAEDRPVATMCRPYRVSLLTGDPRLLCWGDHDAAWLDSEKWDQTDWFELRPPPFVEDPVLSVALGLNSELWVSTGETLRVLDLGEQGVGRFSPELGPKGAALIVDRDSGVVRAVSGAEDVPVLDLRTRQLVRTERLATLSGERRMLRADPAPTVDTIIALEQVDPDTELRRELVLRTPTEACVLAEHASDYALDPTGRRVAVLYDGQVTILDTTSCPAASAEPPSRADKPTSGGDARPE